MHLIMILIIFFILFGSSQEKGCLWLVLGSLFLLITEPKLFLVLLLILIVVAFIIFCISTVESDFQESNTDNDVQKVNEHENLPEVDLENKNVQISNDQRLEKNVIPYDTNIVYQDFGETERKTALSTNYNGDFTKFIKDYGVPTHISVIDSKNSLAFYKNLDLIVIYNPATNQIIKRESTR